VAESQESAVQMSPSSQPVPVYWHVADVGSQTSFVQASESLQNASVVQAQPGPGSGVCGHESVASLQTSDVQGSPSAHASNVGSTPSHSPQQLHVSRPLQNNPSWHGESSRQHDSSANVATARSCPTWPAAAAPPGGASSPAHPHDDTPQASTTIAGTPRSNRRTRMTFTTTASHPNVPDARPATRPSNARPSRAIASERRAMPQPSIDGRRLHGRGPEASGITRVGEGPHPTSLCVDAVLSAEREDP
jgi:hypothetical protein